MKFKTATSSNEFRTYHVNEIIIPRSYVVVVGTNKRNGIEFDTDIERHNSRTRWELDRYIIKQMP